MKLLNPIPIQRLLFLITPFFIFTAVLIADVQQTNLPSGSTSSAAEPKRPVLWTLSIGCGDSFMTNAADAHFKMRGFVAQMSLRRGRGRSWLEILADYYSNPDGGFRTITKAFGFHGSWGWNLWNKNSTTLYAKAGMGISWSSLYTGYYEKLLLWGVGTGVEQVFTRGWGVRLEGRIEAGALYLNRTGHITPTWIVISLGLLKQF